MVIYFCDAEQRNFDEKLKETNYEFRKKFTIFTSTQWKYDTGKPSRKSESKPSDDFKMGDGCG